MIKFIKSSMFLLLTLTLNQSFGQSLLPLKAAELACHRVDRLVVQKKIDQTYLTKFEKLQFVKLAANDPSGAPYQVIASQAAPETGNPLSLSLYMDATGKVLKHEVNAGGLPGRDVQWTAKDPISITEEGLHHLLDEYESNAQLRPFAEGLQTMTITQKVLNGATVAIITITSEATPNKLNLILDLNGELINKEIVP